MKHRRYIIPVGKGGFAIEMINEDYVVAYDCGSSSSPEMVEQSIDCLCRFINHIDILFISHFDKDHVNGVRYLLNTLTVRQAVTPFIPELLRAAYGMYTNGSYSAIMNLLRGDEVETIEVGGQEDAADHFSFKSIWEWVAKSMMTNADFSKIKEYITGAGLNLDWLSDADYVERNKLLINKAFETVFGSKGPNSKGLIMLSQPSKGTITKGADVIVGACPYAHSTIIAHKMESSCLFVGDADLKNIKNRKAVIRFWADKRTEGRLLLMQIPHHGSRYNLGSNLDNDYPAHYYFLNDVNTNRLQKTNGLYLRLTNSGILLVSGATCRGLILSVTAI